MKPLIAIVAPLLLTLWAAAAESEHFIRLEIISDDADGTQINMTVPLSMLYSFEGAVRDAITDIEIDEHGINLQEIWTAIKETGPMDYVEIMEGDTTVTVSTSQTHILVSTEGDGDEMINAMVPFALCDALFTPSEEFDFDHLMDVLSDMAGTDIVNIQSEGETIRIWIE